MYQEMIIPPLFVQNLNNFRHGKVRGEGYSTNFSRRKYRVCTKKGVSGAVPCHQPVLFVVAVGGWMMLTLAAYHANAAFGQATTKTI